MALSSDEIDFEHDDDEVEEELEEQLEDQDDSDSGDDAEDAGAPPAKPTNAWERMRNAIADMGDGKKVRLPGEPEEEDDDEEESDEETPPAKGKGGAPQDKTASKPESEQPAKPPKPPVFSITDADGEEAELDWPEGAKIRFKADGRQVEVKNLDELVSYAQKGVAFDRRSSEWGQERSRLSSDVTDLREQVKTAEELLIRAVFDKEARTKLRTELRPYRDPKIREAFAARDELEKRQARDRAQAETTDQELQRQFWTNVEEEAKAAIADLEHVDDGDVPAIMQTFYQNYETYRDALAEKFKGEAKAAGVTEEQAIEAAHREALTYLTEENLRAVAKAYEDHYATKAGKKGSARKGAKPNDAGDEDEDPDEANAIKRAERHNARVQKKLEQRNRPRPLRGGGAAPGGSSTELPGEGLTFEQRMDAMRRELRKATKQ